MVEMTVRQASKESGLSPSQLSRLLSAGRIQGRKEETPFGIVWYVDVASLHTYPSTRRKPGPKPKQEQEKQAAWA